MLSLKIYTPRIICLKNNLEQAEEHFGLLSNYFHFLSPKILKKKKLTQPNNLSQYSQRVTKTGKEKVSIILFPLFHGWVPCTCYGKQKENISYFRAKGSRTHDSQATRKFSNSRR